MAPDEPTPMVRQLMWVEHPSGTHLSQAADGGYSPLARADGTNELTTHATLFPLEDEEDRVELPASPGSVFVRDLRDASPSTRDQAREDELAELLGELVLFGATKALQKVEPHVRRLWDERALPAIRSTWNSARASRGESRLRFEGVLETATLTKGTTDCEDSVLERANPDHALPVSLAR